MVATPQDPHILARIARLEATVKNMSQKGLTAASVGEVILPPGGAIKDTRGTVLFQSDPLGGMAYPWYSVPLLQTFIGPTGPSSTASWPSGDSQGFQQMATNAPGLGGTIGVPWFAGFLPYVSHPRIQLQTFSYPATSGGTATWEIGISTNGFSSPVQVGTFVSSNFSGQFDTTVCDLTPWLGLTGIGLSLILKSFTGGNGLVLMQPYGCFLRGSV
jgi:hypothetical protein